MIDLNDRYLFKAKRLDNGEWVQGFYFCMKHNDERTHIHHFIIPLDTDLSKGRKIEEIQVEIDSKTLCQCTGLKGKNGALIWENNIVKCEDIHNGIKFIACVEFGNPNGEYNWGWQLRHVVGDMPNLDILLWVEMEEAHVFCEVIGNIFDNPELLEV